LKKNQTELKSVTMTAPMNVIKKLSSTKLVSWLAEGGVLYSNRIHAYMALIAALN
jgi:hypothetical protein